MKKITKATYIPGLIIFLICTERCKKDAENINITLYDKPLSEIQSYVQGNWKLQYEEGGYCGNCINHVDSFYWHFYAENKIQQTYKNAIVTDTLIIWKWDKPVVTDSTYLMNFWDKGGVPYLYIVDEIKNDTLVLIDAGYDPVTYYLTRSD